MFFQQIRSATIKLKYDNVVFLIDPWLRDSCASDEVIRAKQAHRFISTPVIPLPMPASEVLEDVDHVLVTHLHSDHFTSDYLPAGISLVLQNEEDMGAAQKAGFKNTSFFKGNTLRFGGVTVTRVSGQHGDNVPLTEKMGQVSGFIFEAKNEKTIYVAGDTVFYDGVKENIERFRPEVIIINACDAQTSMGRLIMNKEDVIELCRFQPDILIIASHMDAVSHAHLTRDELRKHLSGTQFQKRVYIPDDGEMIQIS